jgi:hypothetical protein
MNDYQVGQILFLISGTNKIVPVQVFEEVIRTTIHGKEKTYIIKFPDSKGSTSDINKIKSEIFNSTKDVKEYMINNATNAINQMISEADSIAAISFSGNAVSEPIKEIKSKEPEQTIEKVQQEVQKDIITIDLGNGKFGKISPSELEKAGVDK